MKEQDPMRKTLYDFEMEIVELLDQALNELSSEDYELLLDYFDMKFEDRH